MLRVLNDSFVPVKVNIGEQPKLAHTFGVFWTPTLIGLHHRGIRLRKTVGYLSPNELLAELLLMRGFFELRSGQPVVAVELLRQMPEEHPGASVAPEAIYWEGVAAYRIRRDKEDLWKVWRRLAAEHPGSLWAMKTTLLEETPPETWTEKT